MKQICSRESYRAKQMDWTALRTMISRAAFIAGLALMGLTFCATDAVPLRHMVITGIAGAVLTLASMRWTGWGDFEQENEQESEEMTTSEERL